jgi:membrane protease subunit (stomatin/prohibitin family)
MPRIIDVLEFFDQQGDTIVQRLPEYGPGDFRLGSQLVVRDSQWAIFFRDGKAMDVFEGGRHTLSTANLPLLSGLIGLATSGKTPFQAEVIFINRAQFIDQKWGTSEPQLFSDPDPRLGSVYLRARGKYSFRVTDPTVFVNSIVGQQGIFEARRLQNYMRDFIVSEFMDLLAEMQVSVFQIQRMRDELSAGAKAKLNDNFENIGLQLMEFVVASIAPDDETAAMIKEAEMEAFRMRTQMGVAADMQNVDMRSYSQMQAAQAMRDMANNPGGGGDMSSGAGLGAGVGMGAAMANMMNQAMNPQQQQGYPPQQQGQPPQQSQPAQQGGGDDMNPQKIQQMIDKLDERFMMGEINQETYDRLLQKWQDKLKQMGG